MTHTPPAHEILEETRGDAAEVLETEQSVSQKLDVIIHYLHSLDRRDKIRTYGGVVRGLLALIPTVLFLLSAWYIYQHGAELMKDLASEAAKAAGEYSKDNVNILFDQFQSIGR